MPAKNIQGIIAPLITPFTKEGELDEELLKSEVCLLIKARIDGISPGGSTGEGAAVTDEELIRMVKIIRSIDQDILIVAGVIRNSTQAAVKACLGAKAAGADAVMVTPVSYNVLVPDDDGNYSFYETISKEVGLPIVIYNVVPQNTIHADLFKKISKIENVIGIKQSCGGITSFYEMKMRCGNCAKIFSATDEMLYSTFELGADGAISAILTVFPELCVQMWKDVENKNLKDALEMQNKIYPVWQTIAGSQFPIRIKFALSLLGRNAGYPRGPIVHISESDKANIKKALKDSGFIK
jgi:dihydrodipicolinate synthase/N-acetylneuraminate lyase